MTILEGKKMVKRNYKMVLTSLLMLTLLVATGFAVTTTNAAPAHEGEESIVVAFDLGHHGYHARESDVSRGVYEQFEAWGYTVVNITEFNSSSLANVDILITFAPRYSIDLPQFTADELQALKNWFNQGEKAVWVTGDSDFGDTNGTVAAGLNDLLIALESNVLVEQASVESELNAGAEYRVRPGTFNTEDDYVAENFYKDNVDLSATGFFHGPAPLIGRLSNGTLVKLENNDAFFNEYKVHWIIAATNNATYKSWINRHSLEGLEYQVHDQDEEGSFVMMTAQEKQVTNGESRLVVSGEAIMTLYRNMLNTTDEYGNPSVNLDLVKNTMEWLSFKVEATTPEEEGGGIVPGFEFIITIIGLAAIIPTINVIRKRK